MASAVSLEVVGGPSVQVPWKLNMTAQDALEAAYDQINSSATFTYALQFYGSQLGYLVLMINETYDSFISSAAPFFLLGIPGERSTRDEGYRQHHPVRRRCGEIQFRVIRSG